MQPSPIIEFFLVRFRKIDRFHSAFKNGLNITLQALQLYLQLTIYCYTLLPIALTIIPMKQIFTFLAVVLVTATTFAQIGINNKNPDASAALDITSTTGGILIPRMTEIQRDAISLAATGLMIYQTDGRAGFYYYNGSSWSEVGATAKTYTVNTFYAELGGYVIEVNSDGTHGLVVAMQDQGMSNWYQANDLLNNAANHDTDGAKFKDWRLPTKRDLNLMYSVYINGNGARLNTYYYWSSSEQNDIYAWTQYLFSGAQTNVNKLNTHFVRAVRAY